MIFAPLLPKRNEYSGVFEYELYTELALERNGVLILLPKWFSYNGASLPGLFWQAIYSPFDPIVMMAALFHDWLYLSHITTREESDLILLELLRVNDVPETKCRLIYDGVRGFGGLHWNNTEEDIKYMAWLCNRLRANGIDPARYQLEAA